MRRSNQIMREGDVVALSGRTDQAHRIAQRVAGGVDFGAQAAAGPAKALGMRPLFAGARRPPAGALERSSSRSSAIPDRPRAPGGEDGVQNPHLDPAIIAPAPARADYPQQGVEKLAIVGARTALAFPAPRHKNLKPFPLVIPKRVAVQSRSPKSALNPIRALLRIPVPQIVTTALLLGEASPSTCGSREIPWRLRQRCSDERVRCGIVG
jgi:hypothetical protein